MDDEAVVSVKAEADIIAARQAGRDLAALAGFSTSDQVRIATAISEVARNIVVYVGRGEVLLKVVSEPRRIGLRVVAVDRGPGISDLDAAIEDGYSTSGGLGLGLPGARRLMDDFEITSGVDRGTQITMHLWTSRNG
ncbi:MAG: anti-sigma regulatory factor [Acidimicrobiaceae bacterium]|nr:anti-sigma regulatory factor [Acidimicrobiaceae bacterium]